MIAFAHTLLLLCLVCSSWKYWLSPFLHGLAMAIVVAYDFYRECYEGKLNHDWKVEKPVDFFRFREKLASQMLSYNPKHAAYPGDKKTRLYTQQSLPSRFEAQHSSSTCTPSSSASIPTTPRTPASVVSSLTSGVTVEDVNEMTKRGRLCGDLGELQKHLVSLRHLKKGNKSTCVVCGKKCLHPCTLCDKPMHIIKSNDPNNPPENTCFSLHHDTNCLGLSREDYKLRAEKRKDFQPPTPQQKQQHLNAIKRFGFEIAEA